MHERCVPDVADALVGVGLICNSENMPGVLMLDKDYNNMSKFLNRSACRIFIMFCRSLVEKLLADHTVSMALTFNGTHRIVFMKDPHQGAVWSQMLPVPVRDDLLKMVCLPLCCMPSSSLPFVQRVPSSHCT